MCKKEKKGCPPNASVDMLGDCWSLLIIALEVGFENQAHFTTMFGKFVGMTPRQFQRSSGCEAGELYSPPLSVVQCVIRVRDLAEGAGKLKVSREGCQEIYGNSIAGPDELQAKVVAGVENRKQELERMRERHGIKSGA